MEAALLHRSHTWNQSHLLWQKPSLGCWGNCLKLFSGGSSQDPFLKASLVSPVLQSMKNLFVLWIISFILSLFRARPFFFFSYIYMYTYRHTLSFVGFVGFFFKIRWTRQHLAETDLYSLGCCKASYYYIFTTIYSHKICPLWTSWGPKHKKGRKTRGLGVTGASPCPDHNPAPAGECTGQDWTCQGQTWFFTRQIC